MSAAGVRVVEFGTYRPEAELRVVRLSSERAVLVDSEDRNHRDRCHRHQPTNSLSPVRQDAISV